MDNKETYIDLSEEEIRLGFVASCVEYVAQALGCSFADVYQRMKRVGMLEGYIYKHYGVIHAESREHITQELIEYLQRKEAE